MLREYGDELASDAAEQLAVDSVVFPGESHLDRYAASRSKACRVSDCCRVSRLARHVLEVLMPEARRDLNLTRLLWSAFPYSLDTQNKQSG